MSTAVIRSVSWLVRQIASVTDASPQLHNVVLEAEIFNFHAHASGHWYFSLKDDYSRIDCTMWENDNLLVNFGPKNGDRVKVLGSVTVYTVQGKVQFTVKRMVLAGKGDLKAQFDALYRKLYEEGLFAAAAKKPIPGYPMQIGLVTGANTHARADVYNTLRRRWPIASVKEFPSLVQGETAPAELIAALKKADASGLDVILLCRGGGSMEDLWCFNNELLARTIYGMKTPVITGIGHEPDYTIADYVADLRAPTPTGAAEQASPDIRQVYKKLNESSRRMHNLVEQRLLEEQQRIDMIKESAWYSDPAGLIQSRRLRKDLLEQKFLRYLHTSSLTTGAAIASYRSRLEAQLKATHDERCDQVHAAREAIEQSVSRIQESKRQQLSKTVSLLDAYSPLKVLARGYSVVMNQTGVINDAGSLQPGDHINIRMHKGSAEAIVEQITMEEGK